MAHPTNPSRDLEAASPGSGRARAPGEPPILGPLPSAREDDEAGAAGEPARFRRPERPSPSPGEVRLPGTEDPFGAGGTALAAPSSPERGLSEPLVALAAAFQANSEALRRSQEMQAELGRALQRADRSEVLLQSTGALNDTFKGLTNVQRTLLQRIDRQDEATREGRWFLPLLVLAAVAVVGAGLWLVVKRVQEMERDVIGNGDVATQLAASYERGLEQGRQDAGASEAGAIAAWEGRVARLDEDLKTAIAEREAREQSLAEAREETASLRGEVLTARADSLRVRAIEDELNRLRAEGAVRAPELERLKRELAEEKATNASLRSRLAELGMAAYGRGEEGGAAVPAPAAPAATAAPLATPPRTPAEAAADARGLERARERLNTMLQESGRGRSDYLQLAKVGAVSGDVLVDVMATRYAANGRVLNFVRARELRIQADRETRRVEFHFADGALDHSGTSVPFPGGTFTAVVAEGDQTSAWTGSGLTFVATR